MKFDIFMARARRNLESARLLLSSEDSDSACNRAYYAMREAARAALCVIDQEEAAFSKTHSGLKSQFNLHLIKPGLLPKDLNAMISFASERRIVADYDGVFLAVEDVRQVIGDAELFLAAVDEFVNLRR